LSVSGKSGLLNSIKCIILKPINLKIKLNEENYDSVSPGNARKSNFDYLPCQTETDFGKINIITGRSIAAGYAITYRKYEVSILRNPMNMNRQLLSIMNAKKLTVMQ